MNMRRCPVCLREEGTRVTPDLSDWLSVECQTCGYFRVPEITALTHLGYLTPWVRPLLSHWLRKAERRTTPRTPVQLSDDTIRSVTTQELLPMPREQADNALLWIGDELRIPDPNGNWTVTDALEGTAIIGASNPQGFRFIFNDLIEKKLFRGVADVQLVQVGLTLEGWDRYEELRRSDKRSRLAFMAMPFNNQLVNNVFEHFRQAVADTGFELRRVIDEQGAGLIDDQIRVGIRRSRFLVCELTGNNLGAYWEAGFAEGIGIPVIYTCEKGSFDAAETKPHFDTNHWVTVIWQESDLAQAARKLKTTIRATLPLLARMKDP